MVKGLVMDIPLNAHVVCTDGSGGKTVAVVLNPSTEEVTHIVVSEPGFLGESVLVPLEYISESSPEQVRLRLSRKELAAQSPFVESDMIALPPSYTFATPGLGYPPGGAYWSAELTNDDLPTLHASVPKGELTLQYGDSVEASDGHIGRIDELLIDPQTNEITHLVLREGHFWDKRDVTIDVKHIDRIEEHIVYLTLTKQQIEALPDRPVTTKE
jgi:sporulation protein YlmC with PRC-barrel domain